MQFFKKWYFCAGKYSFIFLDFFERLENSQSRDLPGFKNLAGLTKYLKTNVQNFLYFSL